MNEAKLLLSKLRGIGIIGTSDILTITVALSKKDMEMVKIKKWPTREGPIAYHGKLYFYDRKWFNEIFDYFDMERFLEYSKLYILKAEESVEPILAIVNKTINMTILVAPREYDYEKTTLITIKDLKNILEKRFGCHYTYEEVVDVIDEALIRGKIYFEVEE